MHEIKTPLQEQSEKRNGIGWNTCEIKLSQDKLLFEIGKFYFEFLSKKCEIFKRDKKQVADSENGLGEPVRCKTDYSIFRRCQ